MVFDLYDSSTGGNSLSGPITNDIAIMNGLFEVNLDFGPGAFSGSARYLDIMVQSGTNSTELSPRQQVLPSPYALYATVAATVTNGAIMNAQLASNSVSSANIRNNAVMTAQIASNSVTDAKIVSVSGSKVTGMVAAATNAISAANAVSAGSLLSTDTTYFGDPSNNVVVDLTIWRVHDTGNRALTFDSSDVTNGTTNAGSQMIIYPNGNGIFGNGVGVSNVIIPHGFKMFNTPGTNCFTNAAGVYQLSIEGWGGGGGGGFAHRILETMEGQTNPFSCGGGAGGYARGTISVTPTQIYQVTVGAGGQGGGSVGSPGQNGQATTFNALSGTNLFICGGGQGGEANSDSDGNPLSQFSVAAGGSADTNAQIQIPGQFGSSFLLTQPPIASSLGGGPGGVGALGSVQIYVQTIYTNAIGQQGYSEGYIPYGSGGSGTGGGLIINAGIPDFAGANGTNGCIVISW
jgi:hypothetical protein